MEEVDELVLERFRIIFRAVKDYGSLLGGLREVGGIKVRLRGLRLRIMTQLGDVLFIRRKIKH